jgi:hypothetical protein
MTLKSRLLEWTDWDYAMYYLGIALGLIDESVPFATKAKHVFWTNNPVGVLLMGILDSMVVAGILLKRDEPDYQFRWNSEFIGSWEQQA